MLFFLTALLAVCFIGTLLSGNLPAVIKNIKALVNNSLAVNSLSNYWPTVKQKMIVPGAGYSSVLSMLLAFIAYLILVPVIFNRKFFFQKKDANHKDFFKSIDEKKIAKNIQLLNSRVPAKATKNNYQLNLEMLLEGLDQNEVLESFLQKVANKMCTHLLISKPIKVITLENIPAGKYERIGDLNCIYVNSNLGQQNLEQKIAILAHEMAHYYLDNHQIHLPDTNENELLTEVCTAYIGFGLVLLNGYKVNLNKEQNAYSKVGYVDEKVILESVAQTATIRKQNPNWIIKNVSLPLKILLKYRLKPLIASYNLSKQGKAKI